MHRDRLNNAKPHPTNLVSKQRATGDNDRELSRSRYTVKRNTTLHCIITATGTSRDSLHRAR